MKIETLKKISRFTFRSLLVIGILYAVSYTTSEPITVLIKQDGSQYVIKTSKGDTYRPISVTDLTEGRITYIKE